MRLAVRELLRRPAQFVTATVVLTLIALLLMFLGGLLDGLIRSQTGAVRAQDGQAIVYSSTAQASFPRSRIEAALRAEIEAIEGVDEVGGLGLVQLGARVPGNQPRDLADVALFGYELAPTGVPPAPGPGEAHADEVLKADGFELGMTVELGPARSPIRIVGFVSDTSFNGQGGLWAATGTWREILAVNRPDARLGQGVFQALVVQGDEDVVDAIDIATGGRTDTYSIDEAVDAIPGVSEQRTTFNQIIGVTIAIALAVIALFFALITVERIALYGVLKALGARSSTIFAGLVVQAVAVTVVAAAVAGSVVIVLDAAIPAGSIPLDVTAGRLVTSLLLLLLAAIAGCGFSLRRVLKVDPASALDTNS